MPEYLIQGLVGVGVTEGEGGITSELLSEFVLLELWERGGVGPGREVSHGWL